MTENIFPKIPGDALYASEVNRFNPKFIGQISERSSAVNISGTSVYVNIGGSILYPATGSLMCHDNFSLNAAAERTTSISSYHFFRFRVSGAGMNFSTGSLISSATAIEVVMYPLNYIVTSGEILANGGNMGSPCVFFVEGRSDRDATSAYLNYFRVMGN